MKIIPERLQNQFRTDPLRTIGVTIIVVQIWFSCNGCSRGGTKEGKEASGPSQEVIDSMVVSKAEELLREAIYGSGLGHVKTEIIKVERGQALPGSHLKDVPAGTMIFPVRVQVRATWINWGKRGSDDEMTERGSGELESRLFKDAYGDWKLEW